MPLHYSGHIAALLVRFVLVNKGVLAFGWAPRVLVQCRVPYVEIWDVFHEMYESQVSFLCVALSTSDAVPDPAFQ
jgi:hypothetical protein